MIVKKYINKKKIISDGKYTTIALFGNSSPILYIFGTDVVDGLSIDRRHPSRLVSPKDAKY